MNKTSKLVSLGLLTAMAFSTVDVNADCVSSGFGVGITLSATQNKITFNDKNIRSAQEKAREDLKTKLKSSIAATQKKFEKENKDFSDNNMENDGSFKINGYKDPSKLADSANNCDATNLPKNPEELTINLKKFKGDNPTKYRILTIDEKDENQSKYDANGMIDAAKGSYITKQPIVVNPNLLKDNNITELKEPDGTDRNGAGVDSKTNLVTNYSTIKIKDAQGNEKTYYIVPRDEDMLDEISYSEAVPTHALWSDIFTSNSNDKITNAFVNDVIKNDSTLGYKKQFTGDEWYTYDNKTYINTVKHKDLGLTDDIINNTISTLAPNKAQSNTFKDVSQWSFDLGFNIFYQHRIFDWFIRAGLFGNFPIANRTISLVKNGTNNNKDSKDKKSSSNDLSLTHSFDIGAQLLAGYNVTQNFALVFGAEVGYSRYVLNNLNQLSSGYSLNDNKIVEWLAAGSSKDEVLKDYNVQLKTYGLSDNTKEKSFNKWFWRGIVGCEFNLGKCIVGLQAFFGPNTTLMKASNSKDFGDLKIVNGGVRANIAFKF